MTNDPNPNDETNARQRLGSGTPGLGFVILHSDLVIHSGIRGFGDSGTSKMRVQLISARKLEIPAGAMQSRGFCRPAEIL